MTHEQEPPKKRYKLILPDDYTQRVKDVVEIITPFIMLSPSPFELEGENVKPKIVIRKRIVPEVPADFK